MDEVSRQHKWFVSNHSVRTLCNLCGEALHGVAWNGLSCEGEYTSAHLTGDLREHQLINSCC